jgi:hypothetical protein
MREFIKFNWLCIKDAWRGCWTRANETAGVLGAILLWIVLWWISSTLREFGLIDAPTTYWGLAGLTAASAVASVSLSFVVIFLGRLLVSPARLYWQQRKKVESLETQLRDAENRESGLGPDWPIHELFLHLQPEILDRPNDSLGQKAGDEIRDALSLGRLHLWGRPTETKLGKWVGERASLRPIDKTYWEKAYFTFLFLYEPATSTSTHCYADRNTGRPAYGDLQINRAEALSLWPGEPTDIAENYPNVRVADSPTVIELFEGAERAKLIALLMGEKLLSWARISASTSHDFVLLKGNVWGMSSMRVDPKLPHDPGTINQSYIRPGHTQNAEFYDVCMNYTQLKRAWPSLPIRRTKCDVL